MKKEHLDREIDRLNLLVRRGQGSWVPSQIEQLWLAHRKQLKVLRPYIASLGQLARRSGDARLATKLLHPWVRSDGRVPVAPSSAEIAEYAIALLNLGGREEAHNLLQQKAAQSYPSTTLYQVFCLFSGWQYEEAELKLKTLFNDHGPKMSYEKAIVGVNWLSSMAYAKKWTDGLALADELKNYLKKEKSWLLLASVYELETHIYFFKKEQVHARAALIGASDLIQKHIGQERLYLERWKVLLPLLSLPADRELMHAIDSLKCKAYESNELEVAREIDFIFAYLTEDSKTIRRLATLSDGLGLQNSLRLYFEIPKLKASEKIRFQHEINRLKTQGRGPIYSAELLNGGVRIGHGKEVEIEIPLTKKERRLLGGFFADGYRPLKVITAAACLNPGSHFSPFSSPISTHQILFKLRQKMIPHIPRESFDYKEIGWNLDGTYNLSNYQKNVPIEELEAEAFILDLRREFGTRAFQISDISGELPRRSLQRKLAMSVSRGDLEAIKAGRYSVYRVK